MGMLGWFQVVLGLLAISTGAMVLRGVLLVTLSGSRVIAFLRYSLIASLVGLLPLTGHLAPIQRIYMLSVYCSGFIILAWRKFHLAGLWRSIFAFLIVAVLYLNVASVSTLLFSHSPLSVLGVLAVRMCHAQRTNSF
jgi:energy-converting hydrogenase Eha subunit C